MLAIVATTPTDNTRPTTTTVKIFSNMILPSLVGVALLPRPIDGGEYSPASLIILHRRRYSIQCRFHRLR